MSGELDANQIPLVREDSVGRTRCYPLLLGQAGKPVVIDVARDAAVIMAVAAELLCWLI